MNEKAYQAGSNAAWTAILSEALRNLGANGSAERWRVRWSMGAVSCFAVLWAVGSVASGVACVHRQGRRLALARAVKTEEASMAKKAGTKKKPAPSCEHVPKKAALDSSVWCIRCAAYLGEAN